MIKDLQERASTLSLHRSLYSSMWHARSLVGVFGGRCGFRYRLNLQGQMLKGRMTSSLMWGMARGTAHRDGVSTPALFPVFTVIPQFPLEFSRQRVLPWNVLLEEAHPCSHRGKEYMAGARRSKYGIQHFNKPHSLSAHPGHQLWFSTMYSLYQLIEQRPQNVFSSLWMFLGLYVFYVIIYRIWFHSLAKYPGPFLARFTDIYPMVAMFKMTRCHWQNEMVQKYGSPVRVATNQLFFADMKSWVDIYGQSSNPCLKEAAFYDQMTATGATSVFNATNKVEHARVRRLLSHAFSLSGLLKDEPIVLQTVLELDRFVFAPAVRAGEAVDIFGKTMCHFLDISSYFSYGKSFDTVSGQGEISHADMDCL